MCLALRATGLWLGYAMLQNLIPSFPWIAPQRPPPWRNPWKGSDQLLPSGILAGARRGQRCQRFLQAGVPSHGRDRGGGGRVAVPMTEQEQKKVTDEFKEALQGDPPRCPLFVVDINTKDAI